MRLGGFFAQALLLVFFVLVIVAGEECPLRIAFAGKDMRGDAVEEPGKRGVLPFAYLIAGWAKSSPLRLPYLGQVKK
jgi:hypothetical protein